MNLIMSLLSKKRPGRGRPGRRPPVEAWDTAGYDLRDPFLFTSPLAVKDCREGMFTHLDGTPRSLEDFRWDLETEVMRRQAWTLEELEFRAVLDRLLAAGFIEETGQYWNNSPHGVVYRIRETVKIRLQGRIFRLRRGRHLVFQCRMTRERFGLKGPFLAGTFAATADSLLCGEMANAMAGRTALVDAPAGTGLPGGSGHPPDRAGGAELPLPPVDPAAVEVEGETLVVYFLVDVSGSMDGLRLAAARDALLTFMRTIPTGPRFRVGLRAFNEGVSALQGSLHCGYGVGTRLSLIRAANLLRAGGSTAVFQAVWRALDDLQRLIHDNRTPSWHLILLSDGEDNRGADCSYEGFDGIEALIRRIAEFRRAGLLEYLPIAYGSGIEALDCLGGPGFHAEVTDPRGIAGRFADIRQHLMLGLPDPGR